jgi:hypothetical protein
MANRVIRAGQVERVLKDLYLRYLEQIQKNKSYPYDMTALHNEYDSAVYSATRKAVTEMYMEGANYVGYKTNTDIYPSDTDLLNIRSETNNLVGSFWGRIKDDAKRTREQEVVDDPNLEQKNTASFLATIAGIGAIASLAVGTTSKAKQVIPSIPRIKEEPEKPKIKWIAQLDEKTCQFLPNGKPGCASLDGTEWDYDDPEIPVPGRLGDDGTHPNCRCYLELG